MSGFIFGEGTYKILDPRVTRVTIFYERLADELVCTPDDELKAKWDAMSEEEKIR